jgi:hypothetical protein
VGFASNALGTSTGGFSNYSRKRLSWFDRSEAGAQQSWGDCEIVARKGQLEHCIEFARDYYEVEITPADVAAVYRHDPLTNELVRRPNPRVDVESLAGDMNEIGYPEPGDTAR